MSCTDIFFVVLKIDEIIRNVISRYSNINVIISENTNHLPLLVFEKTLTCFYQFSYNRLRLFFLNTLRFKWSSQLVHNGDKF